MSKQAKPSDYPDPATHWDDKAWARKIGITRPFLKPPNESVWELADLVFGRSLYEEIVQVPPSKNPANAPYYLRTEFGHFRLRPEWRKLLPKPDPHARIPIHVDPTYEWCKSDGGVARIAYVLWEPQKLLNSVCQPGPVLDAIVRVMHADGMADSRPVTKALNGHFRATFLPAQKDAWKERYDDGHLQTNATLNWETHKNKVLRYWDDTVHLVSGCLLHHFQVWPDAWYNHLFNSPAIDELFENAKLQIEHVKAGGFTFDFPT